MKATVLHSHCGFRIRPLKISAIEDLPFLLRKFYVQIGMSTKCTTWYYLQLKRKMLCIKGRVICFYEFDQVSCAFELNERNHRAFVFIWCYYFILLLLPCDWDCCVTPPDKFNHQQEILNNSRGKNVSMIKMRSMTLK